MVARQQIHNRVLESMPHVQTAGHIRWRDGNAKRTISRARSKRFGGFPALINSLLNVGGLILIIQSFAHSKMSGSDLMRGL